MRETIETARNLLESVNINPTPNRLLVLEALLNAQHPISITDIDTLLDTVDQSTIFRSITLFEEKKLVFCIDDGTKSPKYELVMSKIDPSFPEHHVHFYCEGCNATYCIPSIEISNLKLPSGYTAESMNFVVKGKCSKCSKK